MTEELKAKKVFSCSVSDCINNDFENHTCNLEEVCISSGSGGDVYCEMYKVETQ